MSNLFQIQDRLDPQPDEKLTERLQLPVRLLPSEIQGMLALFAQATPWDQLALSIYSAAGAARYLEALAAEADLQKDHQFWGLKDAAGGLLAAAHTRTLGLASHLNLFAVEPKLQGQGLGTRLLTLWEGLARSQGAAEQTLDVADTNTEARRLYLRHGFGDRSAAHEFRLCLPPPAASTAELAMHQWPSALANLETYGFGQFQVALEGTLLAVNMTRTGFRSASADPRILALLQRLDPEREILLRTPDRHQNAAWEFKGTLHRMQKNL